jgi:HD-GYP domain-containing protein (c-di-GMP phosphodiesterase class II)
LTGIDVYRAFQTACLASSLNGLVDVDLLLTKILRNARLILKAEAGTVYLVNSKRLLIQASQNDYLERLIHEADELPFLGVFLEIDSSTLAGYAAMKREILTVNNTQEIDFDAPFQHLMSIDNSNNYNCQAIMSIPLISANQDLLGILQLINPLDDSGLITEFDKVDEPLMAFYAQSVAQALERALMFRASILNSVKIIGLHDQNETMAHAQRVSFLTTAIYKNWALKHNVSQTEIERVLNILPLAAMLHDVGKAWVPDNILNKPCRLEKLERKTMEEHVLFGARLYLDSSTPLEKLIFNVISDHHERWDGLGYPGWENSQPPKGKKGEEISVYGRILAVADVYDALSSRKAYKEPYDESLAVQIMQQESGRHFDPSVVESFMAIRPVLSKVRERFPEELA